MTCPTSGSCRSRDHPSPMRSRSNAVYLRFADAVSPRYTATRCPQGLVDSVRPCILAKRRSTRVSGEPVFFIQATMATRVEADKMGVDMVAAQAQDNLHHRRPETVARRAACTGRKGVRKHCRKGAGLVGKVLRRRDREVSHLHCLRRKKTA